MNGWGSRNPKYVVERSVDAVIPVPFQAPDFLWANVWCRVSVNCRQILPMQYALVRRTVRKNTGRQVQVQMCCPKAALIVDLALCKARCGLSVRVPAMRFVAACDAAQTDAVAPVEMKHQFVAVERTQCLPHPQTHAT